MARNKYPGICYCCGAYVPPGFGHFERYEGGWRVKCVKCASGRVLTDKDSGVQWAKKQTEEIKPCPFCGLYPKVYKAPKARGDVEEGFTTSKEVYTVECRQTICDVQPKTRQYTLRAGAVEAWDRRVTQPSPQA